MMMIDLGWFCICGVVHLTEIYIYNINFRERLWIYRLSDQVSSIIINALAALVDENQLDMMNWNLT